MTNQPPNCSPRCKKSSNSIPLSKKKQKQKTANDMTISASFPLHITRETINNNMGGFKSKLIYS